MDVKHWLSQQQTSSVIGTSTQLLSATTITTASAPTRPPTKEEIALLQRAFASFYGTDKDVSKAVELLSETIDTWEKTQQPGDEIAGLFRVRGDAFMVSLSTDAAGLSCALNNVDMSTIQLVVCHVA
jgi:hypothetical protein